MSSCQTALMLVFAVALVLHQAECLQSEKVDEGAVPTPPAAGIACTMCSSCENPCGQRPPPPPPVLPPPPPPPNSPSGSNCPPPPPSPPPPFFYFTGQPGELYPIEPYHVISGACSWNIPAVVPFLLGCGLLGLWAI